MSVSVRKTIEPRKEGDEVVEVYFTATATKSIREEGEFIVLDDMGWDKSLYNDRQNEMIEEYFDAFYYFIIDDLLDDYET